MTAQVARESVTAARQGAPFAPRFDHLVYLRVFEGCNLHCQHCFIPANPKRMELDDVAQVPTIVRAFAAPGSSILLQWHGGEPTLFGARWMRDAIDAIHDRGGDLAWKHGIQTNLLTYSDDWARLYHDHFGGEVGISWDPGIRLLRRDDPESFRAYDERFWEGVGRLKADGLRPYLVVTFTRTFVEWFRNPMSFLTFLTERGIERAHLERVTPTGEARRNWARIGLNNAEYSRHMGRFLRAYRAFLSRPETLAERPLSLSPFDGLMQSVMVLLQSESNGASGLSGYGCWSGACDTRFHTIDANGYKRGCTALTSEVDNPRAGADALKLVDLVSERRARQRDCGTCRFRPICSSGCMALDSDDGSGECTGGFGLFDTAATLAERQEEEGAT